MAEALDEQLNATFAARDRENMMPTIQALLTNYKQHPNNPRVLYELGGAYDTAGEEATALGLYESAMGEGLSGETRRRCYLQYGSTLRNLGRPENSSAVFTRARREFQDPIHARVGYATVAGAPMDGSWRFTWWFDAAAERTLRKPRVPFPHVVLGAAGGAAYYHTDNRDSRRSDSYALVRYLATSFTGRGRGLGF